MFYLINNIRIICSKIVNLSNSGHPGMPLGVADFITILWFKFIKFNINFLNKDKLVISNGHGVLIQYVLLYLSNIYNILDLKNFRKIFSKTPAHPEFSNIIDASTGPLGQGVGISVGIGLKEKILSLKFNNYYSFFNNKVWTICGDGCIMEGVSNESVSFCGSYNINNIIIIYDSNNITIDGMVKNVCLDNIRSKFISLNWDVIGPINGHCYISIFKAFNYAKNNLFPTLIIFETIIGFLSPDKSYHESVHGTIFNFFEYKNILKNYRFKKIFKKKIFYSIKNKYVLYYIKTNKKYFFELLRNINRIFIFNSISFFVLNYIDCINKSTRILSNLILTNLSKKNYLIGGSADLTNSNLTKNIFLKSIKKKKLNNNYINYGIREFGMSSINYGISLFKIGFNFISTFLVFSNYMLSSIRNYCLSKINTVFIFTHDSFSIGEDGPSHQPVEQLQSLRIIPRIYVFRPFNLIELIISWIISLKLNKNPASLILTRQNFNNNFLKLINLKYMIKCGYFLNENYYESDLTIISSGSDLSLCLECKEYLKQYFKINVISIFCNNIYEKQNIFYKKNILNNKKILIIESSNDDVWYKYNNEKIFLLNINKFGKSGSENDLRLYFNHNKKFIIKLCLYIIGI